MIINNIKTVEKAVENTNIVGNASCVINNTVAINNITIHKNSNTNELYVQMPQMKNARTGNCQDIVFPLDKEGRNYINNAIINQFFSKGNDNKTSIGQCSDNINCQLYNTNGNSSIVANGSITIDNELAVKGVKVVKSSNGNLFVALPSSYNKNTNKSYSIVAPASKDAYKKISNEALSTYKQSIENKQENAKATPPAEKEIVFFSYKELTAEQIKKISTTTNVKFDCSDMQENGNYIIRFNSNDKVVIDNALAMKPPAR